MRPSSSPDRTRRDNASTYPALPSPRSSAGLPAVTSVGSNLPWTGDSPGRSEGVFQVRVAVEDEALGGHRGPAREADDRPERAALIDLGLAGPGLNVGG